MQFHNVYANYTIPPFSSKNKSKDKNNKYKNKKIETIKAKTEEFHTSGEMT